MVIYPAIDVKDGKVVRLKQGKFDEVTIFDEDIAKVAKNWEKNAASFIHMVDLDGAKNGSSYNKTAIEKAVKSVKIPVQLGGGIHSMKDIEEKFEMGIYRVILGTSVINEQKFVKNALDKYKERIVIGLDALNGKVSISAWEKTSNVDVLELAKEVKLWGAKTIVYTDISKDGMMSGVDSENTHKISKLTGLDIIASGGVSSKKDLEELKNLGIHGAIVGKALYNNTLDLKELIQTFEKE